jgi:two-component system OmpR family response regulator
MTTPALIAHRPRLLVVDDEASIAELMRIWFEPVGWDVVTASSGPEGVARAAEHAPDAVVLDVMLPGYGGLEVLRRIRLMHPRVTVVLSTARDSDEDRAAGIAAGADAYLVKPYSLVELESRLRALLDQHLGSETWRTPGSSRGWQ